LKPHSLKTNIIPGKLDVVWCVYFYNEKARKVTRFWTGFTTGCECVINSSVLVCPSNTPITLLFE